MKFTYKVFFCTIVVIALAMGCSGLYLVSSLFDVAIKRETRQALDENDILCFAFETIALNVPLKYERLQDKTIEEIAATLKTGRFLRISDEQKRPLYFGGGFNIDNELLNKIDENTRACQIVKTEGHYFVHSAVMVKVIDRSLYLETFKDVSVIFEDRDTGFTTYRNITMITLLAGALIMYAISLWLTRPIKILSNATKSMAAGNYSNRARKISNDELGSLTVDFNAMSKSLEEKIHELREETASRNRFVAAFAHELKTPLTAIIGYADLLRSRKLEEEEQFMSADYIYREGKRLEALSFKLLDIIVLKKNRLKMRKIPVSSIFEFVSNTFCSGEDIVLTVNYEEMNIRADATLLTTVLINLIDNAAKASEKGGRIEVGGQLINDGYMFYVKDYGCGIAEDEIGKITQEFYMVDKSRSRSRHGAGLGLTLCAEILALHNSSLKFESILGEGTCVRFVLASLSVGRVTL